MAHHAWSGDMQIDALISSTVVLATPGPTMNLAKIVLYSGASVTLIKTEQRQSINWPVIS